MVSLRRKISPQPPLSVSASFKTLAKEEYKYQFSREITPPPPKA
jgi:hypothetical protein